MTGTVPDPRDQPDSERVARALAYMDLVPDTRFDTIAIDRAFIGSCSNGRIEDLRAAAPLASGRRADYRVRAIVVPDPTTERQPETEGLAAVISLQPVASGVMPVVRCAQMNDDRLARGGPSVYFEAQLRGSSGAGLLAITLAADAVGTLAERATGAAPLTVDLVAMLVTAGDDAPIAFGTSIAARLALINGWDGAGTILDDQGEEIAAFEARPERLQPWLHSRNAVHDR